MALGGEETTAGQRSSTPTSGREKGEVTLVLPCDPEDFNRFVAGLLGKPQELRKVVEGAFEISHNEVINTFHLVDQRLRQQNDAVLIHFTVRIVYDDHSSVLLNSIDDFLTYREVAPLVSTGVHLSWSYLIRFQDRKVPEKQEIELSATAKHHVLEVSSDDLHMWRRPSEGGILLEVTHTARTWGVDILNLLDGHVKTWLRHEPAWKRFVREHSVHIAFSTFGLLFLGTLLGAYWTATRVLERHVKAAAELLRQTAGTISDLDAKLNFLLDLGAKGIWPRTSVALISFLAIAFFVSVALSSWVGASADNRFASFVVLTKKSEEKKAETLRKAERKWWRFGIAVAASIASGVLSNIAFSLWFAKWFN